MMHAGTSSALMGSLSILKGCLCDEVSPLNSRNCSRCSASEGSTGYLALPCFGRITLFCLVFCFALLAPDELDFVD